MPGRNRLSFIEPFHVPDTLVSGIAHVTPALDRCHRLALYTLQPCADGDCMEAIITQKLVVNGAVLDEMVGELIRHGDPRIAEIYMACREMARRH